MTFTQAVGKTFTFFKFSYFCSFSFVVVTACIFMISLYILSQHAKLSPKKHKFLGGWVNWIYLSLLRRLYYNFHSLFATLAFESERNRICNIRVTFFVRVFASLRLAYTNWMLSRNNGIFLSLSFSSRHTRCFLSLWYSWHVAFVWIFIFFLGSCSALRKTKMG